MGINHQARAQILRLSTATGLFKAARAKESLRINEGLKNGLIMPLKQATSELKVILKERFPNVDHPWDMQRNNLVEKTLFLLPNCALAAAKGARNVDLIWSQLVLVCKFASN